MQQRSRDERYDKPGAAIEQTSGEGRYRAYLRSELWGLEHEGRGCMSKATRTQQNCNVL
jgi:hypothetical protein